MLKRKCNYGKITGVAFIKFLWLQLKKLNEATGKGLLFVRWRFKKRPVIKNFSSRFWMLPPKIMRRK